MFFGGSLAPVAYARDNVWLQDANWPLGKRENDVEERVLFRIWTVERDPDVEERLRARTQYAAHAGQRHSMFYAFPKPAVPVNLPLVCSEVESTLLCEHFQKHGHARCLLLNMDTYIFLCRDGGYVRLLSLISGGIAPFLFIASGNNEL